MFKVTCVDLILIVYVLFNCIQRYSTSLSYFYYEKYIRRNFSHTIDKFGMGTKKFSHIKGYFTLFVNATITNNLGKFYL